MYAFHLGRDIDLRESYKLDEENKKVTFKIVMNKKTVVQLEGKSVKTLRKRAFKKAFFYLIDEYRTNPIARTTSLLKKVFN